MTASILLNIDKKKTGRTSNPKEHKSVFQIRYLHALAEVATKWNRTFGLASLYTFPAAPFARDPNFFLIFMLLNCAVL